MNVLITAYIANNLGDDLFIYWLCTKYDKHNFYIINDKKYNIFPICNLKFIDKNYNFSKDFFDYQIFIGGSIFMQSNNKSIFKQFKNDISKKINDIPNFIIGANFGPFKNYLFLVLYKKWFKTFKKIIFRDFYSYNLFKLKNMDWAPDIVFNLNFPKLVHDKMLAISVIKFDNRTGLGHYNEMLYYNKIRELIIFYMNLDFKINLFCFCKEQKDDLAANEILEVFSNETKNKIKITVYDGNIQLFMNDFLKSSFVIGSRFHSIILALNSNIPIFPICYNLKHINALKAYNFLGNFSDIQNFHKKDICYIDYNRTIFNNINIKKIKTAAKKYETLLNDYLK